MANLKQQNTSLSLSHQELLQPLLRSCNQQISEYSFANLYLFRTLHSYQVIFGKDIYIKGKSYDGLNYLMPTSIKSLQALVEDEEVYRFSDFLFPIPPEWLQLFDMKQWQASYKQDDSDYIFDTLHLSRYPGRGLSKKRNLVTQLKDSYDVIQKPLDNSNTADVLLLLDTWVSSHIDDKKSDIVACKEAIIKLDVLGLEGMVYYVEDKAVAVLIGEALSSDTFVMHFAKADTNYKGIYQYIYQAYAQSLENRFSFINMEQDLGSPGLRQAKHSYEPIRMCHKMRLKKSSLDFG